MPATSSKDSMAFAGFVASIWYIELDQNMRARSMSQSQRPQRPRTSARSTRWSASR